jgi:hypothetical protein
MESLVREVMLGIILRIPVGRRGSFALFELVPGEGFADHAAGLGIVLETDPVASYGLGASLLTLNYTPRAWD